MRRSWEFGLWNQSDLHQAVYLVDGKTKLKIWDRDKIKDGLYVLSWDEAKTLVRLCNSPTVHLDYGLVGNAGVKVINSTVGKLLEIAGIEANDGFHIPQEWRSDMLYLSMVYLGADPHATELLFSPEEARQFWK